MAAKTASPNLFSAVLAQLEPHPEGVTIEALARAFSRRVSRRTLQRRLAEWVASGAIQAQGIGKARRYAVPAAAAPAPVRAVDTSSLSVQENVEAALPVSADARAIRDFVRLPIAGRPPVGYRREFLEDYEPNVTRYLSDAVARHLREMGRTPQGDQPAGTYARDIFNRLLIDLSWASSRLEGNTYSLLDTEQLIQHGRTAAGKDAKETQMILNHKAAIELLVESAEEIGVNRFTLLNLHAVLADNLLDDPRQAGRIRTTPVGIGGSTYLPMAIPQLLETMFMQMLTKAAAIRDEFEQSFFLLVQLPYLQPFIDVNKRTSRLAANIPLIRSNLVPLSFIDVPQADYVDGLVGVYEMNRVELLRDVFVWAYERSCRRYKTVRDSVPEPDPFRLAHRQALIEVIGRIVRERLRPTPKRVATLARAFVSTQDVKQLTDLVVIELEGLHEGNIARFRLRPSELKEWQRARKRNA